MQSLWNLQFLMHFLKGQFWFVFIILSHSFETFRFGDYVCARNLIATMLHPAFKKQYVQNTFPGSNTVELERMIIHEMDSLDRRPQPISSQRIPTSNTRPNLLTQQNFMQYFFGEETELNQNDNASILGQYFLEKDKQISLLLQPKYAKVKKLFIKYNTQLLSSASCERLFSLAKHVLTYSRTQLSDENFEVLVVLNSSRK